MSVSYIESLSHETRDVINYLRSRPEICDLKIDEIASAGQSQINEWEIKNLCSMPTDLKQFYLNHNGISIEWNFSVDDQSIPLGRINVNPLRELTRVSTALHKNLNDPSLFDVEDVQVPPKKPVEKQKLQSKSSSTFSASSLMSLGTEISNISLSKNKTVDNETEMAEIFKKSAQLHQNENETDTLNDSSSENENDVNEYYDIADLGDLIPHFGETSNNFELDNCNGYGKVCLVYKARRSDCIDSVRDQNIKDQTSEIWFLDRSLQWHYLTDSFQNYYRLLIAHLGLPQWQGLFTEDGLPPFLYQWYYMLAPGRILVHENNWQKLQFLTMFENNHTQTTNKANKNQTVKPAAPVSNNKIDFQRLFDDKLQKSRSQNKLPSNSQANNGKPQPIANIKPKSRNSLKK